jgi:hypothetical protein
MPSCLTLAILRQLAGQVPVGSLEPYTFLANVELWIVLGRLPSEKDGKRTNKGL